MTDDDFEPQLLLTRSKELANKLKRYTQRLIDTRLGTIGENSTSHNEQEIAGEGAEAHTTLELLALREEEFPLVCTFDYFLRLVENSIRYAPPDPNSARYGVY